jgi:hypothetical protein
VAEPPVSAWSPPRLLRHRQPPPPWPPAPWPEALHPSLLPALLAPHWRRRPMWQPRRPRRSWLFGQLPAAGSPCDQRQRGYEESARPSALSLALLRDHEGENSVTDAKAAAEYGLHVILHVIQGRPVDCTAHVQ